jgi:hypothetical protein
MASLFNIPTIHRLAGPFAGSQASVVFAGMPKAQRQPVGVDALTNGSIAPAWRRAH